MISIRIDSRTNPSPQEIDRVMREEFRRMMKAAAVTGETAIARRTPVGVSGHLRQGIVGIPEDFAVEFGVQGPGGIYGKFVEPGRKRGKFPPFQEGSAIFLWVRRTDKGKRLVAWVKRKYKVKDNARALRQAVFLKARAIARRGTRPALMFKKSIPEIQKFFERTFPQTIAKIEKRLGDG